MFARLLRRRFTLLPTALLGLSIAGCSGPSEPVRIDEGDAEAVEKVTLEVIDETIFADVLKQNRGKVVLVDFWATWCGPCRELFPHTVQLQQRFADRELAVITISLDDPDDDRSNVLEFLTGQEAAFENFVSRYGTGTESTEAFKLDGPLPQFKLYDRQGKLHTSFGGSDGNVDPRQIDRAVEELLGS